MDAPIIKIDVKIVTIVTKVLFVFLFVFIIESIYLFLLVQIWA